MPKWRRRGTYRRVVELTLPGLPWRGYSVVEAIATLSCGHQRDVVLTVIEPSIGRQAFVGHAPRGLWCRECAP